MSLRLGVLVSALLFAQASLAVGVQDKSKLILFRCEMDPNFAKYQYILGAIQNLNKGKAATVFRFVDIQKIDKSGASQKLIGYAAEQTLYGTFSPLNPTEVAYKFDVEEFDGGAKGPDGYKYSYNLNEFIGENYRETFKVKIAGVDINLPSKDQPNPRSLVTLRIINPETKEFTSVVEMWDCKLASNSDASALKGILDRADKRRADFNAHLNHQ